MLPAPTASVPQPSPELLRSAFGELHGPRLHGFALLLTLGDQARATRLAGEALAAGAERLEALRHPERAAAWLRSQVVRANRGGGDRRATSTGSQYALARLGVDPATHAGLAALRPRQRAALVLADVERLDRRDVETVVGLRGPALDRLLARARLTYLCASSEAAEGPPVDGPLVERLNELATRTLR